MLPSRERHGPASRGARAPRTATQAAPVAGGQSVVITKTPFRMSFFGGGTDYPQWYRGEGGAVLSTSIDKYCYISCRYLPPFFDNVKHRIVWSHIETVSTIAEILHPAVREGLRFLGFDDSVGLEIHHQGDLPARSGIGSSSAFSVGLIKGLLALRGQAIGTHELALKAIDLEQNVLGECVGSQDQVAAAHGGLNVIRFERDGAIRVQPLAVRPARTLELESRLLLFYLGTSRLSAEVARGFVAGMGDRRQNLLAMRASVDRAVEIVTGAGDLDAFGRLLHEGWLLKREIGGLVTNARVDAIYGQALDAGALGGKLLGAGGSGFLVFYVPPDRQPAVRAALAHLLHVPFAFEREGCTIRG
jgi:D-glycero-alpha-D-manno-heptose-7-phosphate kinase